MSRARCTRSSTRSAGRCGRAASTASSAARSCTRWATTWSRSASSSGSSTATSSSRPTTCSRSSRRTGSSRHPRRRGAHRLGREDDHRGRLSRNAVAPQRPGPAARGGGAGLVNVPRLKGIHYAIESGRLAAEAIVRSLQRGESPSRIGALDAYDESLRESYVWKDLREVRNMRQVFDKGFYVGGALASGMIMSKGRFPPKDYGTEPNAASELLRSRRARATRGRTGRSSSTSSRRCSRRATGRATTSRIHPHPDARPAGRRRGVELDVPRARVRGRRAGARRHGGRASRRPTACSVERSPPRAAG